MPSVRAAVLVTLGAAVFLSSCGGSQTPAEQVRGDFARLQNAERDHDASTVCQLLARSGANLQQLETRAGRANYLARCQARLAKAHYAFDAFQAVFRGASLGTVTVHGGTAAARITLPALPKVERNATVRFVKIGGSWRLLLGAHR